jgi:hypothetical protein
VVQQGFFPNKGDSRVYIKLLGEMVVLPLALSSSQHSKQIVLCPQLITVFARHSDAQEIQNLYLSANILLIFSNLIITRKKTTNKLVWKVCLMAKNGLGIMISLDLSLS